MVDRFNLCRFIQKPISKIKEDSEKNIKFLDEELQKQQV